MLSLAALLLLSPIMLLIALAIKVSSRGPVFYRQARLGLDGKPFDILKFRSMITNAPALLNADGSTYTGDDDPRVTKIGRFIRKTSLDELPQFFNVLAGSMSLVGPRPDKVDQLSLYAPGEEEKLWVKPGITGLAQVNGRNAISWESRKKLDIEYVRRQSLLLDFELLFKTVPYVLLQRGVNAEEHSPT